MRRNLTAFGMLGWGGAAMLAAIDLFKPTLAPNIRGDIKNGAFGWALVRSLMLAGFVGFSALAANNTLMNFAAHRSQEPDRQAAEWHSAKDRLDKARQDRRCHHCPPTAHRDRSVGFIVFAAYLVPCQSPLT